MKKTTRSAIVLLSVLASLPGASFALNPVIQTMYTADPAPVVHDGTFYLFSGHDEDERIGNFNMKNWVLSTTTDMVNWTQHGAIASLRDIPWAAKEISGWHGFENGAWASQAIERDGKWYLYFTVWGRGIGVLVADNPLGPYTSPLDKPLINAQYDSIDPTVCIDDEGQAYLAWGNPNLWSVKLNKDMISYDTSVGENGLIRHPMTVEALGERTAPDEKRGTSYEEGPWLYKRNNLYYLFFAAGPLPEPLGYSTGPSAEGPWTYRGVVMAPQNNSFTNHPGVVDYKGKTYLVYHNGALPGGGGFNRSVCVEELKFNPDGSIQMVQPTKEGPAPVATLDPYKRVEAETIAWSSGVKIEPSSAGGQAVREIHDGDHIRVNNVDFGATGARSFFASLSSTAAAKAATGAKIEIRLGKLDGQLIGTLPVSGTDGEWTPQSTRVSGASGVNDLFFVFRGAAGEEALFKFDHWQFSQRDLTVGESYNPVLKRDAQGNPLFTADPAALVEGDTLYVYAGRDEAAIGAWFNMNEWVCYSTKDMVDWKYEGVVLKATDFAWGRPETAWACQVIKRHGKYFLYSTTGRSDGRGYSVGVAVSDRPTGPFIDVIGGPLFDNAITTGGPVDSIEDIDPTVFVDDDGQAYLYWGNVTLHYALLNEDMISLKDLNGDGKITEGADIFSKIEIKGRPAGSGFGEAPWLYKANRKYYLVDAMSMPQQVAYAMSDSPRGPWQHKGVILNENRRPDGSQGDFNSDTSHPAVIEFKGQWYVFYHSAAQPTGGQTRRSVCVEKMSYNADGSIARSFITSTGPLGGAVRIQSGSQTDHYITFSGFDVKSDTLRTDDRAFRWDLTQGLADEATLDTVSIQSVSHPGYYLTVKGDAVALEKNDASEDFRRRATFKTIPVPSDKKLTAFQSLADPSRCLRCSAVTGKLTAEIITSATNSADKSDATFKFISDADAY